MRLPVWSTVRAFAHTEIRSGRTRGMPKTPIQHPIYNRITDGVTNFLDPILSTTFLLASAGA